MYLFTWTIKQFLKVISSLDSVVTPFGFTLYDFFVSIIIFNLLFDFLTKLTFTVVSRAGKHGKGSDKIKKKQKEKGKDAK